MSRLCKCGDPSCQLWREDIVCPWCSAKLQRITSAPEFAGRGGDMGEGHYADCRHGLAADPAKATAEVVSAEDVRRVAGWLRAKLDVAVQGGRGVVLPWQDASGLHALLLWCANHLAASPSDQQGADR